MTPYEIIKFNTSVLRESVGRNSYTITVDFVDDPNVSVGKFGALINNDVDKLMATEPDNNSKRFFEAIQSTICNVAREMGKDHEDFDDIITKSREWFDKNGCNTSTDCPYKFYFTSYCKQNKNIWEKWKSKLWMMFAPHQFVIHVVRDCTLDSYSGGYFIQIHSYEDKDTYFLDDHRTSEKNKFFVVCKERLDSFGEGLKTPIYRLTNPSLFGRLKHWFSRSYFRYNSFITLIARHLKFAFTGTFLNTNH